MSKEEFINNIKKWVALDNQIKQLNTGISKHRNDKQEITSNICGYMEDNSLLEKKIEISNGNLKVYEKKEYTPLTFQYIEQCLHDIIKNENQVDMIIQYLKKNREIKTSYDIRRNNIK
jgi:hypothetical protein